MKCIWLAKKYKLMYFFLKRGCLSFRVAITFAFRWQNAICGVKLGQHNTEIAVRKTRDEKCICIFIWAEWAFKRTLSSSLSPHSASKWRGGMWECTKVLLLYEFLNEQVDLITEVLFIKVWWLGFKVLFVLDIILKLRVKSVSSRGVIVRKVGFWVKAGLAEVNLPCVAHCSCSWCEVTGL